MRKYFSSLTDEQLGLIYDFVQTEGNLKELQKKRGVGYTRLKTELLELRKPKIDIGRESLWPSHAGVVYNKLRASSYQAEVPMLRGKPMRIWTDGKFVYNDRVKNLKIAPEQIMLVVRMIEDRGGSVLRGDQGAQSGALLGSEMLPLDSLEGWIAENFHGRFKGETTTRRSTYYAAILAWAGIVDNRNGRVSIKEFYKKRGNKDEY